MRPFKKLILLTALFGVLSCYLVSASAQFTNIFGLGPYQLNDIAYDSTGGIAVAVGNGGHAIMSSDLTNWSDIRSNIPFPADASDFKIQGVIWDGGRFLANTKEYIFASTNGTSWTLHGTFTMLSVGEVYPIKRLGSNYFVVDNAGALYQSSDATTWTGTSAATLGFTNNARAIAFDGTTYVISCNGGAIYTSTDLSTWTARTSGITTNLEQVDWVNSKFIAYGLSGSMTHSADGATWTARTFGTSKTMQDLEFDGTNYVFSSNTGAVVSPDLSSWAWKAYGLSGTSYTRMINSGSALYVVGAGSGVIKSTDNGNTWAWGGPALETFADVATNGSKIVVAGSDIFVTSDASTWSAAGLSTMNSLKYSGTQFIGSTASSNFVYSADATTWTSNATPVVANDVAYGASIYVLVGGSGEIYSSTDTVTWTDRTPATSTIYLKSVEFLNGKFIAVGQTGKVFTSIDGVSWSEITTGITANIREVAYGNGVYVFSGVNGKIYTSSDLTTFTEQTGTFPTYTVGFNGSYFFGFNLSYFVTSTDGVTWTSSVRTYGGSHIYGVATVDNRIIAVGANSLVALQDSLTIQSSDTVNMVGENATPVTLDVSLAYKPSGSVTVAIGTDAQMSVDQSSLTFGTTDWDTPQQVQVSGADDFIQEDIVSSDLTFTVTDASAAVLPNYVRVDTYEVHDDDFAGITLPAGFEGSGIAEKGTKSYTVSLKTQPSADVTVNIANDGKVSTDKTSLTFTSANWNTAQTVVITAVNNTTVDPAVTTVLTHSFSSADTYYSALPDYPVTLNVADDESVGVTVTANGGSVNIDENGGIDTFTVVLDYAPVDDVTVAISTLPGYASFDTSSLTFTSSNWNTAQTVTVTGTDNNMAVGDTGLPIGFAVSSADANYNNLTVPNLDLNVVEDDFVGVVFNTSSIGASLNEGETSSYTVALNSEPFADVVIDITTNTSAVTLDKTQLTFTAANWNIAQTVQVNTAQDNIDKNNITVQITHALSSAGDSAYNAMSDKPIGFSIIEDDIAGISLSQSAGITLAETGGSITTDITLDSEPTADVTITLSAGSNLSLSQSSFIFTAANWNTAQSLTITAVDDSAFTASSYISDVTVSISSTDTVYSALTVSAISITITDNDTASEEEEKSGGFFGAVTFEWLALLLTGLFFRRRT
ncbi:MAG: hypothetical protein OEZ47_11240 [Gammaproteobacteria bacterium]|nr:hypothetical protein [Gammaproteobacteria bacterium]